MSTASRKARPIVIALALLAPRPAAAMGAVVGASEMAIASARVAVSASLGRTTRWTQIAVTSEGSFAWLVPVSPGALVDLGSDAWLDALDAATVPVVLPPASAPGCELQEGPEVFAPSAAAASRRPERALVAQDLSSLTAFVDGLGFSIPDSLAASLGDVFPSGRVILALTYGAGISLSERCGSWTPGPRRSRSPCPRPSPARSR
jgi:hypothetical protein